MLPQEKRVQSKDDLNRFLNIELKKYGKKLKSGVQLHLREIDILAHHNILLRTCEYHVNMGHKFRGIWYKIRLSRLQNKYGLHIPINCCDEGLKIMHVGPVLMNGNVCVGKDCSIHINTGLVAGGVSSDAPILGDGVVVGIGAVVVGGVRIANNVAIGANAVVTKNVDDENVAVAGVPAKIVSSNGGLNWNKK